jgi:hypothetical protein
VYGLRKCDTKYAMHAPRIGCAVDRFVVLTYRATWGEAERMRG